MKFEITGTINNAEMKKTRNNQKYITVEVTEKEPAKTRYYMTIYEDPEENEKPIDKEILWLQEAKEKRSDVTLTGHIKKDFEKNKYYFNVDDFSIDNKWSLPDKNDLPF